MSPQTRVWARRAVTGLILTFVAVNVVYYSPLIRLLGLYITGRNTGCSFGGSMEASSYVIRRNLTAEKFSQQSVLLERDDAAGLNLWNTPLGRFWVSQRDDRDFAPLLAEQSLQVYGPLRPNEVVIDGGANIGDFTRVALNAGAKLVVAVEIEPFTLEALRRTFKPEIDAGRVIVYSKGISDRDAKLRLQEGVASGIGSVVYSGKAGPEVDLTTLDKIVAELKLNQVDFIKLDIEGSEIPGLRGARETLRRFAPRIALDSEGFSRENVQEALQLLKDSNPKYENYRVIGKPCSDMKNSIRVDVLRVEPGR